MRYDYASIGFYTYDCLVWPFTEVPPGGGTNFIEELTLAVSGAAGTASIAAAKMGLKTLAVGGVGTDLMGDWVLQRLAHFDVDISTMQQQPGWKTSSSIVTTRRDGSRPALHMKGATADFYVDDAMMEQVIDAAVVHIGGIGLMKKMDTGRNAELMRQAKLNGAVTTVDIFAGSKDDMPAVAMVLPHTDYFMPSIEEAEALTGLTDRADMADISSTAVLRAVFSRWVARGPITIIEMAQSSKFRPLILRSNAPVAAATLSTQALPWASAGELTRKQP